jgi:hypothetical protein
VLPTTVALSPRHLTTRPVAGIIHPLPITSTALASSMDMRIGMRSIHVTPQAGGWTGVRSPGCLRSSHSWGIDGRFRLSDDGSVGKAACVCRQVFGIDVGGETRETYAVCEMRL